MTERQDTNVLNGDIAMRTIVHIAAIVLLLAAPSLALAHARLRQAEPPVDGTVRNPPTQVEITFTEAVEPRFSSITVENASGTRVDKQDTHVTGSDAHRLAVSVNPLSPGTYKVVWRVTAVDTHKSESTFTFTVAP